MKKNSAKLAGKKIEFDMELLKHWKKVSTKAKLEWLNSALKFGKMRSF